MFGRIVLLLLLLSCGVTLLGQLPVPANIEVTRNIVFTTVDGEALQLDLYRPAIYGATLPVVLAIHGGSWISNDRGEVRAFAEALAAHGYVVIAPDYRLAPRHIYPAQLKDVQAAMHWVQANAGACDLDLQRFTILGVSAGAQLAALYALMPDDTLPRPVKTITISTPSDFSVAQPSLRAKVALHLYLGAAREDDPKRYYDASPIAHVTAAAPPFLLLHHEQDPLVPYDQSVRLARCLRAAGVPATLHPLHGQGHALPLITSPEGQEVLAAILDFLK